MKYRNIKTGAIIDSSCLISGGDWVSEGPVKVVATEESKKAEPKKENPKTRKR